MQMMNDEAILLSYVNTKLRDQYSNLQDLCEDLNWDEEELKNRLNQYIYEEKYNRFIKK